MITALCVVILVIALLAGADRVYRVGSVLIHAYFWLAGYRDRRTIRQFKERQHHEDQR